MAAGWIGVDLDGTLAEYDGWQGIGHVGAPITAMADRVRRWLKEGREVRILTARVSRVGSEEAATARAFIERWSEEHLGVALQVTCMKDFGMDELWDDRAVAVEPNTGRQLSPSRRGLDEVPS
jgi:hypothetical protein